MSATKLSRRQREEVEFFGNFYGFQPTPEEIDDYISHTVLGHKRLQGKSDENRLMQAKISWDRTVKMWREDIPKCQLFVFELLEDPAFLHPWAQQSIKSMARGLELST